MAVFTTRTIEELGDAMVLSAERYDPRRTIPLGTDAMVLGDVVRVARKAVHGRACAPELLEQRYLVIDTTDAHEGLVTPRKSPMTRGRLKSSKKLVMPGDVLISRLRPYLRQVAWVDPEIPGLMPGVHLACSTEFYVLRPNDEIGSIAFIAPYLLSQPVQRALSAAQEGGHHPRFDEATLLALPVPTKLLEHRTELNRAMADSVARQRQGQAALQRLIGEIGRCL